MGPRRSGWISLKNVFQVHGIDANETAVILNLWIVQLRGVSGRDWSTRSGLGFLDPGRAW